VALGPPGSCGGVSGYSHPGSAPRGGGRDNGKAPEPAVTPQSSQGQTAAEDVAGL